MIRIILFLILESVLLSLLYGLGIWLLLRTARNFRLKLHFRWSLFWPIAFSLLLLWSVLTVLILNSETIISYVMGGYLLATGATLWLITNAFNRINRIVRG